MPVEIRTTSDTVPPTTPTNITAPSGVLFAQLHLPTDNNFSQCVIMLNSGMMNRVGPQRLYWKFARQACEEGIAVIRVDLAGVGDSLAEIDETHFDNHRKEDVSAIIDYVREQWPQADIILQGLCAGARVSFKAAIVNQNVVGLLAWSTEIFTASQNMPQSPHEPEDRLSDYEVSNTLSRFFNFLIRFKFLSPKWWHEQYPGGKGIKDEIKHVAHCTFKALRFSGDQSKGEFLEAADEYLKTNRKVLFLFGEYDERAYSEFHSRFPQIPRGADLGQCYEVVDKGTHTFSTAKSQHQLIELSIDWLKQQSSNISRA